MPDCSAAYLSLIHIYKEGVFDAIDTLYFALDIYAGMISTMTVNGDKMCIRDR